MTGFSINERNGALSCFRFLIYTSRGFDIRGERIGQEEETVCGQWAQQWCDYRLTHHPYAFASLFGHSCEPFLISICCVYTSVLYPVWNETEHTHMPNQKRNYTHSVYHTHTHTRMQTVLFVILFCPQHLLKVKKLRRHTCCMLKMF
jgi:hypothetical protein